MSRDYIFLDGNLIFGYCCFLHYIRGNIFSVNSYFSFMTYYLSLSCPFLINTIYDVTVKLCFIGHKKGVSLHFSGSGTYEFSCILLPE